MTYVWKEGDHGTVVNGTRGYALFNAHHQKAGDLIDQPAKALRHDQEYDPGIDMYTKLQVWIDRRADLSNHPSVWLEQAHIVLDDHIAFDNGAVVIKGDRFDKTFRDQRNTDINGTIQVNKILSVDLDSVNESRKLLIQAKRKAAAKHNRAFDYVRAVKPDLYDNHMDLDDARHIIMSRIEKRYRYVVKQCTDKGNAQASKNMHKSVGIVHRIDDKSPAIADFLYGMRAIMMGTFESTENSVIKRETVKTALDYCLSRIVDIRARNGRGKPVNWKILLTVVKVWAEGLLAREYRCDSCGYRASYDYPFSNIPKHCPASVWVRPKGSRTAHRYTCVETHSTFADLQIIDSLGRAQVQRGKAWRCTDTFEPLTLIAQEYETLWGNRPVNVAIVNPPTVKRIHHTTVIRAIETMRPIIKIARLIARDQATIRDCGTVATQVPLYLGTLSPKYVRLPGQAVWKKTITPFKTKATYKRV